jgi:Domain of unknown function (DUF4160)
MPTVLNKNGLRFFFYSDEGNEPAHIHVEKGDAVGKIWLEPNIEIAYLDNFTSAEIKQIKVIVSQYFEQFKTKWHEYFQK